MVNPIKFVNPSRFLGPSQNQINKRVINQYQRTYPIHASMGNNNGPLDESEQNMFKFNDKPDDQFTNVQLPKYILKEPKQVSLSKK